MKYTQTDSMRGSSLPSWWAASAPYVGDAPLWPQLYYLIRCGAWADAIAVAHSVVNAPYIANTLLPVMHAFAGCLHRAGAITGDGVAFGDRSPFDDVPVDRLVEAVAQLQEELHECEKAAASLALGRSSAGYGVCVVHVVGVASFVDCFSSSSLLVAFRFEILFVLVFVSFVPIRLPPPPLPPLPPLPPSPMLCKDEHCARVCVDGMVFC